MVAIHRRHRLEILGAYLQGIVGVEDQTPLVALRQKYHLEDIQPQHWYPADDVLRFYSELGQQPAGMFDLVEIGKNLVRTFEYPPSVKTVEDALAAAGKMYQAGWRGGNPGNLTTKRLSKRHVRFRFRDVLFPSDLIYGMCYGMIERFSPDAKNIVVLHVAHDGYLIYDMRW